MPSTMRRPMRVPSRRAGSRWPRPGSGCGSAARRASSIATGRGYAARLRIPAAAPGVPGFVSSRGMIRPDCRAGSCVRVQVAAEAGEAVVPAAAGRLGPGREVVERLGDRGEPGLAALRSGATKPASRSSARCLATACRVTGSAPASAVAVTGPSSATARRTARRVGSASAANRASGGSSPPASERPRAGTAAGSGDAGTGGHEQQLEAEEAGVPPVAGAAHPGGDRRALAEPGRRRGPGLDHGTGTGAGIASVTTTRVPPPSHGRQLDRHGGRRRPRRPGATTSTPAGARARPRRPGRGGTRRRGRRATAPARPGRSRPATPRRRRRRARRCGSPSGSRRAVSWEDSSAMRATLQLRFAASTPTVQHATIWLPIEEDPTPCSSPPSSRPPTAASGRTTSTPACCASASCSSAPRSTRAWPT